MFRIQKIWRSRFAVREKASIEGRLSFDPPQRANSVALGQAGKTLSSLLFFAGRLKTVTWVVNILLIMVNIWLLYG